MDLQIEIKIGVNREGIRVDPLLDPMQVRSLLRDSATFCTHPKGSKTPFRSFRRTFFRSTSLGKQIAKKHWAAGTLKGRGSEPHVFTRLVMGSPHRYRHVSHGKTDADFRHTEKISPMRRHILSTFIKVRQFPTPQRSRPSPRCFQRVAHHLFFDGSRCTSSVACPALGLVPWVSARIPHPKSRRC